MTWGYYHAGGNAQSGWQVELAKDDGTLVASGAGTDDAALWSTGNVLVDLGAYDVRVRLRESSGLWSDWETQSFTVDFPEPNESTVTAAWQDGLGYARVDVEAVSGGGLPETVSHDIARSTDGGFTWTVLAEGLGTVTSLSDWEAPSAGTYLYRVTAHSAVPSMIHTVVEVTVADIAVNRGVWISGGEDYEQACHIPFDISISADTGRSRVLNEFDGRVVPVETSSTHVPLTITVSGSLIPDKYNSTANGVTVATRDELEALFAVPGTHLYRDPAGRVVYGTVSSLRWSRDPGGQGELSFSITRSQRSTSEQSSSLAGYFPARRGGVAGRVRTCGC